MGVSTILSCSIIPNRTGTVPNRACLVAPNPRSSSTPPPTPPLFGGGVEGWLGGGGGGRVEGKSDRVDATLKSQTLTPKP